MTGLSMIHPSQKNALGEPNISEGTLITNLWFKMHPAQVL